MGSHPVVVEVTVSVKVLRCIEGTYDSRQPSGILCSLRILTNEACESDPFQNKIIWTVFQGRDCQALLGRDLTGIEQLFAAEKRAKASQPGKDAVVGK